MSYNMNIIEELRSVIQERTPQGFAEFVNETVTTEDPKIKMAPEQYSISAIYHALEAEGHVPSLGGSSSSVVFLGQPIKEAVDSTAFPKATAALINAKVIDGYDIPAAIGEKLVTTVPSNVQNETIVGFEALARPDEVPEGTPYPHTGFGEKYFTGRNLKYGEILAITEETILFDKTGQILAHASYLGEKARLSKERLIVRGVSELDSGAYNPSGTSTTLYSAGNSNLVTSAAFGRAGLKSAKTAFDDMADEESDFILAMPTQLLVPSELEVDAWEFMNSALTPKSAENADNYFRGRYDILSSPYLTSATDWWLGNFPKEFWWTEVYPLQTMIAASSDDDRFNRDIISKFKVRYFGDLVAKDTRYVVKCTAP